MQSVFFFSASSSAVDGRFASVIYRSQIKTMNLKLGQNLRRKNWRGLDKEIEVFEGFYLMICNWASIGVSTLGGILLSSRGVFS